MITKVETAAEGLAFEHGLFVSGGQQVGLWSAASRAVVCPRRFEKKAGFDAAALALKGLGYPVHLRPTGGGAVPQGPGSVNIALAFDAPNGFTIEAGYRLLTQIITDGLGPHGSRLKTGDTPGSFCDGAWNLSVDGRKIVGTAQRLRPIGGGRQRVLAHALILADESYMPGADAVATFHECLGLNPIEKSVHTSLSAAFGLGDFPATPLLDTAQHALRRLDA